MQTNAPHPMQPIIQTEDGRARFKTNAIVVYLSENSAMSRAGLAQLGFSAEDWEQFAQLTGYSVGGFEELSYVRPETAATARRMLAEGDDHATARIAVLEAELKELRDLMRVPVARLFDLHPDDLKS